MPITPLLPDISLELLLDRKTFTEEDKDCKGYLRVIGPTIENVILPPQHILLVYDSSFSMAPEIHNMEILLKTLLTNIQEQPNSFLSVIDFNTVSTIKIKYAPIHNTPEWRQNLLQQIGKYTCNSMTNTFQALTQSLQLIQERKIRTIMFFITDGYPTVEPYSSCEKLIQALQKLMPLQLPNFDLIAIRLGKEFQAQAFENMCKSFSPEASCNTVEELAIHAGTHLTSYIAYHNIKITIPDVKFCQPSQTLIRQLKYEQICLIPFLFYKAGRIEAKVEIGEQVLFTRIDIPLGEKCIPDKEVQWIYDRKLLNQWLQQQERTKYQTALNLLLQYDHSEAQKFEQLFLTLQLEHDLETAYSIKQTSAILDYTSSLYEEKKKNQYVNTYMDFEQQQQQPPSSSPPNFSRLSTAVFPSLDSKLIRPSPPMGVVRGASCLPQLWNCSPIWGFGTK